MADITTIAEGRFLRLMSTGHWEYVERTNARDVVGIIAITAEGRLLLVEQFRPPLGKQVIELPAGLVGDVPGQSEEEILAAAGRELLEETGYAADSMTIVATGPTSSGLTSEMITLVQAHDLVRRDAGGGDGTESIVVHEIAWEALPGWLDEMKRTGAVVDLKIYAALYLAGMEYRRATHGTFLPPMENT